MVLACLGLSSANPADQGRARLLFGTHFLWRSYVDHNLSVIEQLAMVSSCLKNPCFSEVRVECQASDRHWAGGQTGQGTTVRPAKSGVLTSPVGGQMTGGLIGIELAARPTES